MAITETVEVKFEVAKAAEAAALSVDKLNKAFKDVDKAASITAEVTASAAAKTAKGEIAAAAETLAHAETLEEVASAQAGVVKAVNKNIAAQKKLDAIRKKAGKEQQKVNKARKKAFKEGIKGLTSMGSAVAALGVVGVIGAAVAKTVQWASEVGKTERNMKNVLNILTKGRGEEALAVLTSEASFLNISVGDATDSFKKFRTAGADNTVAVMLLRLQEGIKAVGGTAEEAEAATNKAFKKIQAGEDALKAIEKVAEPWGKGVADGSIAASVGLKTVDGRLKAAGLRWEELSKKAAVPITEALLDFSDIALGVPDDLRAIGLSIEQAFTGVPIVDATGAVVGFEGGINNIPGAVADAVSDMASSIATTVSDWASAGADALSGFIDNFDLVGSVTSMAGDAIASVKSAFGSKSPSTVFAGIGADVGTGFTMGVEDTPPPALPIPLTPALAAEAAPVGGGSSFEVTINVEGGADAENTARAIRREVVSAFNQFGFSGGIA